MNVIWPIYGAENRRVLAAGLMMALSIWNYSGSRGLKDALIVSAFGAESIAMVKVFIVVPMALIFLNFYTYINKKYSFAQTFYICHSIFFVGLFGLFAFVLYPLRYWLHMSPETIVYWQNYVLPISWLPHFVGFAISTFLIVLVTLYLLKIPAQEKIAAACALFALVYSYFAMDTEWSMQPFQFGVYHNFHLIVRVVGNWTYALYYGLSEMVGTFSLTIFSWQILNKISSTDEAKRFYPSVGIIGNIIGGVIGAKISSYAIGLGGAADPALKVIQGYMKTNGIKDFMNLPAEELNTFYTLNMQSTNLIYYFMLNFIIAIIQLGVYYWIDSNILSNYTKTETVVKKSKVKPGAGESFALLASSKYLLLLTIIILGYNISIVPIENVWKDKMKLAFLGDEAGYATRMQTITLWTSIMTTLTMIIGANLLQRISWRTGAMVTPLLAIVFITPFFGLELFDSQFAYMFSLDIAAIPMLSLYAGSLNQIMTKSTKYAFFDPTKEMAYIPTSEEIKRKGKAAVDLIGGRFGKALGSGFVMFIMQGLGMSYSDLSNGNPVLWIALFAILIYSLWFLAIFLFSPEYEEALKSHKAEKSAKAESSKKPA